LPGSPTGVPLAKRTGKRFARSAITRRAVSGGLSDRRDILLPVGLVEVDGQKVAGLVRQKRVDADDVSASQVVEDHAVVDGDELAIRALATLHASDVFPENDGSLRLE